MNTYNIQESTVNRLEQFPDELLYSENLNIKIDPEILDTLVKYYKASYETMNFRKPFTENSNNSIIIQNRANQYGWYQIGSEIFDSVMSSRNVKDLFVLA